MKTGFARFFSDSLLGQLVLVTLIGIGMMQGVNYFTVCSVQTTYRIAAEKTRAETTASHYPLLNSMTPEQRREAAVSLMSVERVPERGLILSILPENPEWLSADSGEARCVLDLFRQSLNDCGVTEAGDIRARVFDSGGSMSGGPLLQTAARLDDGSWMTFTQPLFVENRNVLWMQRLLVVLELLIFGGLIVALLMRVTRPLCRLSCAADFFGRHPEGVCPLPEDGSREVREAAQSFNRMRERVLDHFAERRRMLAAMGHDLRTPLTRAKLRLEEIEPEELREKFAANLADIQSIVEQGLELAGSLQTSEEPVRLDITSFVESVADDAKEQGKQVRLIMPPEEEDGPLVVLARPLCLKRCLENLISNALAYGGGAEIAIAKHSDSVIIDVLDNGPGILGGLLEKVFEPYYRLEGSRNRDSGGAGLELCIARNMACLGNGRVTLENRPEGGLRARLALPRAKAEK